LLLLFLLKTNIFILFKAEEIIILNQIKRKNGKFKKQFCRIIFNLFGRTSAGIRNVFPGLFHHFPGLVPLFGLGRSSVLLFTPNFCFFTPIFAI